MSRSAAASFGLSVREAHHRSGVDLVVVPLGEPPGVIRAGFLVAVGQEDDVPVEPRAFTEVPQQGCHERGVGALHVQCTAAVDPAVTYLATVGIDGPAVGLHRHHVGVAQQQQWPGASHSARDASNEMSICRASGSG
jgi:hypothetical protein